ncbi:hypothetical protein [Paenibacillus sp. sgz500958]|uniref:hypothetical protein n=1 Tax=Paenibacillus sp. sgz500958 TaxID=3242475 RepID=UPI0036D37F3B
MIQYKDINQSIQKKVPLLFHPTVFENIKIAFENQIYDLDNLDETVIITGRSDLLDLAVMSREFKLSFQLRDLEQVTAQVVLLSSLKDLGDEILDVPGTNPGCTLLLRFFLGITDEKLQCEVIQELLKAIWGQDTQLEQTLSYIYGVERTLRKNTIELKFKRQITENQMEDIPSLLNHMLQSLEELNSIT